MILRHHPGIDSSEALCGEEYGSEHVVTPNQEAVNCTQCVRIEVLRRIEGSVCELKAQVQDLRSQVGLLTMFVTEVIENDDFIDILGEGAFHPRFLGIYDQDEEGTYRSRCYPDLKIDLQSRTPINQGGQDLRDFISPRVEPSKVRITWTKEGFHVSSGSDYDAAEELESKGSGFSRWADL